MNFRSTDISKEVLLNRNLLQIIISYLDVQSLPNLATACKYFNAIVSSFNQKWKEECLRHFSPSAPDNLFFSFHNWNQIFHDAIKAKSLWNLSLLPQIVSIKNSFYSNLKNFTPFPMLHQDNFNLENESNSMLQLFLFDLLVEEQKTYFLCDEYFKKGKDQMFQVKSFPFAEEVLNLKRKMKLLFQNTSEDLIEVLVKVRWMMVDEIVVDQNLMVKIHENFPCLYIIVAIANSLLSYAKVISCCLTEIPSDSDFLSEYVLKYKHYVDLSMFLNRNYQNLSIVINYAYDYLNLSTNSFPKFSLIRLCMKIWNNHVLSKCQSRLVRGVDQLSKQVIESDFASLSSNRFNSSISTAWSSVGSVRNSKEETEQNSSEFLIKIFSILTDSIYDEYSVYKTNLSYFDNTNEFISQIEENFCVNLSKEIISTLKKNLEISDEMRYTEKNYFDIVETAQKIIGIFKSNSHYTRQFMPRFLKKIMYIVNSTLQNYVSEIIYQIFIDSDCCAGDVDRSCLEDSSVYAYLLNRAKDEVKVASFLENYKKSKMSLIFILNDISKFYMEEDGKLMMKNKQVNKELKRRNLFDIHFSPLQKKFLSFYDIISLNELKLIEKEMTLS